MLTASLKYMPKYSGNNYELRIGRCKMEDKGEYIVKAENSYGTREEAAFLNVERKFFNQIQCSFVEHTKVACKCIKQC